MIKARREREKIFQVGGVGTATPFAVSYSNCIGSSLSEQSQKAVICVTTDVQFSLPFYLLLSLNIIYLNKLKSPLSCVPLFHHPSSSVSLFIPHPQNAYLIYTLQFRVPRDISTLFYVLLFIRFNSFSLIFRQTFRIVQTNI